MSTSQRNQKRKSKEGSGLDGASENPEPGAHDGERWESCRLALERAMEEYQSIRDTAGKEIQNLKQQLTEAKNLEQRKDVEAELEANRVAYRGAKARWESSYKKLKAENDQLRKEKQQLAARVVALEGELESLNARFDSLEFQRELGEMGRTIGA